MISALKIIVLSKSTAKKHYSLQLYLNNVTHSKFTTDKLTPLSYYPL